MINFPYFCLQSRKPSEKEGETEKVKVKQWKVLQCYGEKLLECDTNRLNYFFKAEILLKGRVKRKK